MAPALAYGRHRGPARSGSRVAAVALTLFRRDQQWWIPLTLRPEFLKHHGGQICLPGGRVEPGEGIVEAAVREYHEELGVECEVLRCCGELTTQYIYASDNRVHPVVLLSALPRQAWRPDPCEVAEVIEMPLVELLRERTRTTLIREKTVHRDGQPVGRFAFRAPAFHTRTARAVVDPAIARSRLDVKVTPLSSRLVWGATAMMLDQLARLLR